MAADEGPTLSALNFLRKADRDESEFNSRHPYYSILGGLVDKMSVTFQSVMHAPLTEMRCYPFVPSSKSQLPRLLLLTV